MNAFWRRFGLPSWSIWIKLFGGFVLVAFLTLTLTLYNIQRTGQSENERNLRQYLFDEGPERTQAILNNFNDANRLIEDFVNDSLYNSLFSPSITGRASVVSILAEGFDTELVASGLFTEVLLVDENGAAAASSNIISLDETRTPRYAYGEDITNEIFYRSVELAIVQDTVFFTDLRVINDTGIGYLVRTLDLRGDTSLAI